jgi:hypothetical protein
VKVPRQCLLVLVVEVRLREGKALGSEKGKGLGCGVCFEQGLKMQFRETVAVYCEDHTEHMNALCGRSVLIIVLKRWYVW